MDENNKDFFSEDESEESFAELLSKSVVEPVHFNPGEKVTAVVIAITQDLIFIDVGGKSEGYIEKKQFLDDEGNITVKEGDKISAYFLSSSTNEMHFTTRLTGESAVSKHLEEAYYNRIPVEGLVEKEIKGGFEVKVTGNTRAFCPFSQMGLQRVENNDQYIGRHLTFTIIEYGEKGRNIIVSHRAVLEEERRKQRDVLKESLEEGMIVTGEIMSIRKFGAFIDIGGLEGLLPLSEIAWGRVEDINSELSIGQKVDVFIKKIDWEKNKFSFSLKEILPDPWDNVGMKYPAGSSHQGTVVRLMPFGAFVNLEPGVDGLVPLSELAKGKRIHHAGEVLEEKQVVEVKIGKVDKEVKRISLTMFSDGPDSAEARDYKEYLATSNKKSSGSLGTLGDLFRDKFDKK